MDDKVITKFVNSKEDQVKKLQKKAKKKYLSFGIASHLYYETDSPLRKAYQHSMYCADVLTPNKQRTKLTTKYCKYRWCPLCSSIRTATLINGYGPQIKELNDPYFVTLTAPTVPAEELPGRIELFGKAFKQIIRNYSARKMGMKGIRKAECTVRPKGLYHYHFHVIIGGKANAEFLVKRWLEIVPGALPQSQDLRPADEGSFIELFKYFTKLVARDKRTGARAIVDYKRLDIIFQALRGKHTFQPFGGLKAVSEDIDEKELEANTLISKDSIYKWKKYDWVKLDTGESLTGFMPDDILKRMIEEVFYKKTEEKPRTSEAKERKQKGIIKPRNPEDTAEDTSNGLTVSDLRNHATQLRKERTNESKEEEKKAPNPEKGRKKARKKGRKAQRKKGEEGERWGRAVRLRSSANTPDG